MIRCPDKAGVSNLGWTRRLSHLHSQLSGLDGSDIATGTRADDHQVDLFSVRVVTATERGGESRDCAQGTSLGL